MSPGLLIGLEMALVLGVVLGLAVWELVRLRRDKAASHRAGSHAGKANGTAPPAP